ncbi:MAG: hypothetical protein ABH875_04550 [Candidatus Omnitrophota bacterium]
MEIDKLLKNLDHIKILRFFHENPNSIDTARGVATWTNVDIKNARSALKRLTTHGLLIAHKVSSTTAYSYTRNKNSIRKIGTFLKDTSPESTNDEE